MTPKQIALVQDSFKSVAPISDTAAQLFYNRLFELDPDLKSLFNGDMREQGRKLMMMIGTAVAGLNDLPRLLPAVHALGRRHAGYGVKAEDFDTVAQALLWTLAQGLGASFTAEVREAWAETYRTLAVVMKEAAHASSTVKI